MAEFNEREEIISRRIFSLGLPNNIEEIQKMFSVIHQELDEGIEQAVVESDGEELRVYYEKKLPGVPKLSVRPTYSTSESRSQDISR